MDANRDVALSADTGSRGGLFWHQEMPESLEFAATDAPRVTFVRGGAGLCESAVAASRIPVGHPEGFIEAFANLYRNFHATVTEGAPPDYPSAEDGAAGLAFVEAALKSSDEERWVDVAPIGGGFHHHYGTQPPV